MKRKKFLVSGSFMLALVAFAGSYHAYTSSSAVEEADLLLANVEALAEGGEGKTTWNCDGKNNAPCKADCFGCNVHIASTGALTGSHTCK